MPYKPSPNSLIHCAVCGEDYSATYKRCPFCGARNAPPAAPVPKPSRDPEDKPELQSDQQPEPSRPAAPADPDDTYVFDGQDLFDDKDEEDRAPVRPKGGKRLAEKSSSNPFANADINWPRMITFICSLIIIVAAMVIVFVVLYPQIWGNKRNPTAGNSQSPSSAVTDSGTAVTEPGATVTEPGVTVTDPGTVTTDPGGEPTLDVPPVDPSELTTISFERANDADFTLRSGESHTIKLVFDPKGWSGAVTWTSTDTRYATVDASGRVTNVNTTNQQHKVIITITAEGLTLESTVYCRGVAVTEPPVTDTPATEPPVTDAPASEPPASDPPATQPPSSSGNVTVGRKGTIVNASGGLNVRSGPGTSYSRIGSLFNGTAITVLEDAGGGWYKISYSGSNGPAEGYIMGDYISTN